MRTHAFISSLPGNGHSKHATRCGWAGRREHGRDLSPRAVTVLLVSRLLRRNTHAELSNNINLLNKEGLFPGFPPPVQRRQPLGGGDHDPVVLCGSNRPAGASCSSMRAASEPRGEHVRCGLPLASGLGPREGSSTGRVNAGRVSTGRARTEVSRCCEGVRWTVRLLHLCNI